MAAEAVRVLDERRWRLQMYWMDFLALGAFVAVTLNLFFEMYSFGTSAGAGGIARDRLAARMMGEAFLAALTFGWITYRVVSGGHRQIDLRV